MCNLLSQCQYQLFTHWAENCQSEKCFGILNVILNQCYFCCNAFYPSSLYYGNILKSQLSGWNKGVNIFWVLDLKKELRPV